MAARNRALARAKIEPAVTELTFFPDPVPVMGEGPGLPAAKAVYYIDLNQCNSLVNRKLFRQGLVNAVTGIKCTFTSTQAGVEFTNVPQGKITIEKLPTTWIMANAWSHSYRAWRKMIADALEEAPSIKPRYLDFKIYADAEHHAAGFPANMLPISGDSSTPAVSGEWESSNLRIPVGPLNPGDTTDREILAVGPNYPGVGASGANAVSAIEGYSAGRRLPDILDPNVPDDASDVVGQFPENWITAIFNEGTEQSRGVIIDMVEENTIAPYPFENDGINLDTMYPGGANQLIGLQIHDFERITGSTIGATTRLRGGAFPCGLIKISIYNYDQVYELQPKIMVQLAPGPNDGLLALPMQEMN